jgi:hypothetical protein
MPDTFASMLDQAAAAMAREQDLGQEDGPLALQFYQTLAETPLILLLEREAVGDDLSPVAFDVPSGRVLLAFDSEERLGAWAQTNGQGALPYAVLPGRVLAALIAGQEGLTLGLNFASGTASEMLLPHGAMVWLLQMLDVAPREGLGQIIQVLPPGALPPALMAALSRGLSGAAGLAERAVLAKIVYKGGANTHALAFFGAEARAHGPLARAVAEALAFSGLEAAALDVIFPQPGQTGAQILRHGTEIALPQVPAPAPVPARAAPGMDKSAPPKLR